MLRPSIDTTGITIWVAEVTKASRVLAPLAGSLTLVWHRLIRYIATHIVSTINIAAVKTTIDISDPLLHDARKIAAREGTTLRALVEQGLRQVVASKKRPATPFRLRDVSFKGRGLQPELRDASWERILDLSYGYPSE